MERPKVTEEMIAEAAKLVAEKVGRDAGQIAMHYQHPMDGYKLARELERCCGWDLSMEDADELDCMCTIVSRLLREAEKKWAIENDIQPPLPVGAKIREGVIEGICDHSAACYRVKENGCTKPGRWLLVKFEEAVAA